MSNRCGDRTGETNEDNQSGGKPTRTGSEVNPDTQGSRTSNKNRKQQPKTPTRQHNNKIWATNNQHKNNKRIIHN